MNIKFTLATIAFSLSSLFLFSQKWEMKQAPIMTPWSENIDPENVLPEYPRPQMERSEWVNLNGVWEFATGASNDAYSSGRSYNQRILVPFPVESAISGIMATDNNNANKNYWYKRTFSVPSSYTGKDIILHFGAVDWECKVWVNGNYVGIHEGGYDPFSFNITPYLNGSENQELVVRVYDAQWAGGFPHGKQSLNPNGIWYMPVTGIWQTVWMEPVAKKHIDDFSLIPDIDAEKIYLTLSASGADANTSASVKIFDGETLLSETTVPLNTMTGINVTAPKLWSPDSPFLYDMEISLKDAGTVTDNVKTYFGMRKIHRGKENGNPCIYLNNKPIFQYGVLDQGWWPDGLYTAPSDEALLFDLEKIKEFGFNLVRKHVKVESARWFYHCDRLGLLVWQDIPNATTNTNRNSWVETNFIREMKNIMGAFKNAPSVITWVVFNEGWGQYDRDNQIQYREPYTRKAFNEAAAFDNSRLINAASGWYDYEIGDFIDKHRYPAPDEWPNPENNRASVCGEYGGINLKIDDHIWAGSQVNYTTVANSEELTKRFIEYVDNVRARKKNGLCAAVYTQITDVESEINGLITYDRKVVKTNEEQTQRIKNKIEECMNAVYYSVLPTSKVNGQTWKYSDAANSIKNWYKEDFDDSDWSEGTAGFGTNAPVNAFVRTEWKSNRICLRKNFYLGDISDEALADLKVDAYYDKDCTVYINGVRAISVGGSVSNYTSLNIGVDGKAALKKNDFNLIAVQCMQNTDKQFIDVGLTTSVKYEAPTGIGKNSVQAYFDIYPNPIKDSFSVQGADMLSGLRLYSLNGQLLKEYTPGQSSYSISGFQEGIYLLKMTDRQKNVHVRKLVKNNSF